MKNRETLLQRKRERRAAQKKLKPPRPPKPAPTREQKAKAREANRLACNRYRATHLTQVRHLNRDYYHRNRERIVQQQRDRRARDRQNKQARFRKLRALADLVPPDYWNWSMDTPGLSQPKKRDPEKNKINQKLYRQRKYAALNGIEDVKALHRRRYHERMARMKANGEYEAFKAKKTKEGMRRYHAMSEEKRNEVRRKNAQMQKNWMQKMKDEGTYEAYKQRLNVRRRELQAEKKRALGDQGWKALQRQRYERRVGTIRRQRWQWLDEQLDRPFPLPWLPLDWADSEPEEEDRVQTIRADTLQQMDHYL